MSKFSYSGATADAWFWNGFCTDNECYFSFNIDIIILYGEYLYSDNPQAVQPRNLPPMSGFQFTAKLHKWVNGNPGPVDSAGTLIHAVPIYEVASPNDCIGMKCTFATRTLVTDCSNQYGLVWSTNGFEVPYGADALVVPPMSGVSDNVSPCD